MADVVFESKAIALQSGESVLEGLERSGYRIPNSCRQGLCHACVMQSPDLIPAQSQDGLSDLQREQGLFLSCCCYPAQTIRVALAEREERVPARVVQKERLSESVLALSLKVDLRWQPGQHVLLWKDEWTARPYSIASHPDRDGVLNLHIERHPQGEVSNWCHHALQLDQVLYISRPEGHCVYVPDDAEKPILMAATGTGLAPLYGVLQDALAFGHLGNIDLYVEADRNGVCYLHTELQQLMNRNPQFTYHRLIRPVGDKTAFDAAAINAIARQHPSLRGSKVYLCGSPEMITALNRQCFMAGAGRSDIVAEPFQSTTKK